jgi:hypothetical protein
MSCLLVRCIHTKESMRHAPCHISDGPGHGTRAGPPGSEAVRPGGARLRRDTEDYARPPAGLKKMEATCLIDHKGRYNENLRTPQSWGCLVLGRPIEGGFAIREGVNWGDASTAPDSRLQVLLLQFGRSRATSHSRCPGGPLCEVLARSRDLGIEPGVSKSRIDCDSRTRTGKSRFFLGEMECLL